MIAED